jgi:hypothetical protein
MSFNSFEETEKSHKKAPAEITGYPETLPAIKWFSPSLVAYTCVYHEQVQRPPTEYDFRYFSVPTSRTLVDFKMVNVRACLRCACVRPVKREMAYKLTYGNMSRILRNSVDLGIQSQGTALLS